MEKIFKREDGTQVKLTYYFVNGNDRWSPNGAIIPEYNFNIEIREHRKKKRHDVLNTVRDTWEYREQPFPHGRIEYERKYQMKYITHEELQQAYIELWESIKPNI